MSTQKTWFITGASKGLGLTLVKQLLSLGHQVAATSRSLDDLTKAVGEHNTNFLALTADLKTEASVSKAVNAAIARFGKLDVVVNNAGYGQAGGLEELSDKEARENFDINVFGALNVIRSVMPQLRKQRSGHILNISSIAGVTGAFPGFGVYCATKFALNGLTESLSAEVKSFGVKVTLIQPGYFRTSFLTSDSAKLPANPIAAYKEVREVEAFHMNEMNGNQAGDPEKAAAVMIKVTEDQNPPLHLILGEDAYLLADAKFASVKSEMEAWREVATATSFEGSVVAH
ncbi:SDR family oxidoreductase [uncultured Chitinophaga sp.]|jgi:Short-chain dehydrogenases of various substrate specificities|uniref:SDR family oxidoreductase n=1 Tax=uncultured Chitinophaga sp. TaxID=339340 RepID=UPI0026247631|nr:SDR family oxidoreductase [uncultured Chitinophaga sp.]